MPINPSLERKLSSMKDEMQAIRDKHKVAQSAQSDQVASQLELIKNKREQMLAAAKKSDEIKNRQNEEFDVSMLVSNMIAEADAKKPPTGQGGRDYEEHVNNILKKHGKADKDATTAGSSADAPDAQFNHGGKKHNLEIKADSKAMFGQMELKHDGEKWDFSEKSKKKYPETHKQLVKSGFLKKINSQWKKPTGKYEDDLKMGNVYHNVDSAEPIKAHYGKDRKTDYIQIGKGHGFYHTGNDAAKLGSPELEGSTQLRARMKARGRDKDGNRTYGALVVMSLKNAPKSHHDLEKEVHKEWIDYILNGPQLMEAVVTHAIEPGDNENHHIIHMTVSKDGKQEVRKATVTTPHGEAHAIKKAYKHYEDAGYEVHGHKAVKELEEIEKEVPVKVKKESVEEGYNNNRTGFAKRHREDDEYHTPDPVKHVFKMTVSKPDGEKHERHVTTGMTTRPKHELLPAAKAHLEKQGYKIHKIHEAVEQIDEAPKDHTIEAHGIKGTKGTPWRKTFKHEDHLNDWAEKNDSVEVHGIRELEGAKKQVKEDTLVEGAYEKAEENKRSAEAAKSQARPFDYHMHMADHHDNMSQWHASKGRHGEADRHAAKSDEHHEKAMSVKEETNIAEEGEGGGVATNSVANGGIAGLKGDAGKKAVMTKEPLKRQMKKFNAFVSQEHENK
jgi:hypothetical protein